MTHDELVRKIKNIEKIEPSQAWISSNKDFIFNYIQAQERNESRALELLTASSSGFSEKLKLFVRGFAARFLLPAASALTVVFLTGNFVLARSQQALPGDALYSVKIFMEKIEVAMTLNDEKRATLNFELADKRLSEISSLAENTGDKNVSGPAVDVAMENFNNHLNAAVNEMSDVVKSDSSTERAVAVAKIANTKTSDYAKKIAKAKDIIGSQSDSSAAKGQMEETIKKIEEVNFNALTVLASLGSEVSQKVEEKINEAAAKTELLEKQISEMSNSSAKEPDIKLVSGLIEQASDILDEAKQSLAANDSGKALEKVIASNDMISTAEKITAASISFAGTASSPAVSPKAADGAAIISPKTSPIISVKPSSAVSPAPSPSVLPTPIAKPSVSPEVSPSISPTPLVSPSPAASSEPIQ